MNLKPWYKVVTAREDLREDRSRIVRAHNRLITAPDLALHVDRNVQNLDLDSSRIQMRLP